MDIKQTIRNQTDVGLRITKQLFQTQGKTENIVYSPLSIHVVLSLIAARSEGSTQDKMLSFLKAQSTDELNSLAAKIVPLVFADGLPGGPCLNFANGLWVEQTLPLMPSFKEVVVKFYKAALKHVDFRNKPEEVRIEVNTWVAKETKGLIEDFLPPGYVVSSTVRIFANALYFKGLWELPFDASRTEESDFNRINGKSPVKAPFMNNSQSYQCVKVFEGFKVLKLMYEQGEDEERQFSMCLFLPDAKDGLPALVERVCAEPGFLDGHLPDDTVIALVGDFLIPKFKMTSEFQPSDILQDLGLVLDSRINHRAVIEVNEQGTEAAAVTMDDEADCCGYDSDYEPPIAIDFVADHPFLFLIREETTGVVLFMGQVLNPLDD